MNKIPNKIKKSIPRYIIIKMLKTSNEETILKEYKKIKVL